MDNLATKLSKVENSYNQILKDETLLALDKAIIMKVKQKLHHLNKIINLKLKTVKR